MKLKKLSGFGLGLIVPVVGNTYAEWFIQYDEYKHTVAIKDEEVKDIDNALVITTGDGSYGYPLQGRVAG